MKLNFNIDILQLDGTPFKDDAGNILNLGKVLANNLVSPAKGDIMKMFDWAKALYAGETIDLFPSDQELLKKTITDFPGVSLLVKARMLEVFEKKPEPASTVNTEPTA
ncbi:MAG TPA: hypothetical protein VFV08_05030 [Puia sp.]|nr:hypothetical protein [Puia sp.]